MTKSKTSGKDRQEQDLYKALSHPLRREILAYLVEHASGSPSEMARTLDASLSDISHHAKQLVKYGAAELAEIRDTRRGSPERVYRPMARPVLSTAEVEKMSLSERQVFAGQIVELMMADLRKAFQIGSFARRSDWVLTRHILELDEEGFQAALDLFGRVQDEISEIQAQSDGRRVESHESPIRMSASQLCFMTNI